MSKFKNFFNSETVQQLLYIFGIIFLFICFLCVGYFMQKRQYDNGASTLQTHVGKKLGELCTSDAMCASNKCSRNICIL
jgi:hypothetical protein